MSSLHPSERAGPPVASRRRLARRVAAATGGAWLPLLLVGGCIRSSDPGSDADLERIKMHDMESSRVMATPLLPGLGPAVRLPVTGSTTTDAVDTVIAALPGGLAPAQALLDASRELVRRGVRFDSALCRPGDAAFMEGITTIEASASGVRGWPAGVELAVAWDEPVGPVKGPNLRLALSVARGGPQAISPPSPTPAPSNCPAGLPIGTTS